MHLNYKFLFLFIFVVVNQISAIDKETLPSLSNFEINKGQFESSVIARTNVKHGYLYITNHSIDILETDNEKLHELKHGHFSDFNINNHHSKITFSNANSSPEVVFGKFLNTSTNYFRGNQTTDITQVKHTTTISLKNMYNNIDLHYERNDKHFKYEYVVHQNAKISDIKQKYEGVSGLTLKNGNLCYKTSFSEISELKPYCYQWIDGQKKEIKVSYTINKDEVSFELNQNYDQNYDLIIDPTVVFSSYSGSFSDNWGYTATYDSLGNMYLGGTQYNDTRAGFPISATIGAYQTRFSGSYFDMVFMKLSSDGKQRLAATYYGGRAEDYPLSMIVNKKNELVVLGVTSSNNFRTTNNSTLAGATDLIITKFNNNLTNVISNTYFGGKNFDGFNLFKNANPSSYFEYKHSNGLVYYYPLFTNIFTKEDNYFYGDEFKSEIQLDNEDNIYLASSTWSDDMPTTSNALNTSISGLQDGILVKFSTNLTLLYSSYIGGTGLDACHSVKIGADNDVYLLGNSTSPTLLGSNYAPFLNQKPGDLDGFLIEIAPTLSVTSKQIWIGTASADKVALIEIDDKKNVYVVGNTWARDFITTSVGSNILYNNPNSGQFIQKYTPDLSQLLLSTRIGASRGVPDISFTAFQIDECNQILLAGWYNIDMFEIQNANVATITSTISLPVTSDAFQKLTTQKAGFYFAVYSENMSGLRYATHFGGGNEEHVDGGTSRFDKKGVIYQAVCAGCGSNSDTKTTPNVWSITNNSDNCNMLGVKINLKYTPIQVSISSEPPMGANATISGKVPYTVNFLNTTTAYTNKTKFEWIFPDSSRFISNEPRSFLYNFNKMGRFEIKMRAIDSSSCKSVDIKKITVFVNPYVDSLIMCKGQSKKFTITGGSFFEWSPTRFLDNSFSQTPTTFADTTQKYTILVTNEDNSYTYQLKTKVQVFPKTDFKYTIDIERDFEQTQVFLKSITNTNSLTWNFNNQFIKNEKNANFTFDTEGLYTLTISGLDSNNCFYSKQTKVEVNKIFIPNIITPNGDGYNEIFTIKNLPPDMSDITIYNRWGIKIYEQMPFNNSWTASDVPDGIYYYSLNLYRIDKSKKQVKGWIQVLR